RRSWPVWSASPRSPAPGGAAPRGRRRAASGAAAGRPEADEPSAPDVDREEMVGAGYGRLHDVGAGGADGRIGGLDREAVQLEVAGGGNPVGPRGDDRPPGIAPRVERLPRAPHHPEEPLIPDGARLVGADPRPAVPAQRAQ